MNLNFARSLLGVALIATINVSFAATAVDLSHQSPIVLKPFLPASLRLTGAEPAAMVMETSRMVDFNQTTHVRVRQTFSGVPVMGSDAIIHLPKGITPDLNLAADARFASKISMNGVIYRDLQADLKQTPAYIFNQTQADKALATAIQQFRAAAAFTTADPDTQLQIYIDQHGKAHYAFRISFMAHYAQGLPAKPTYILDAVTLSAYEAWNDLKTAYKVVAAGGVGGNPTMGKMIYDGDSNHRPVLDVERNAKAKLCYLRNPLVVIQDVRISKVPTFRCETTDPSHNNVYWNTLNDEMNGGYSPNNDGLYSNKIVLEMYQQWFGIPILQRNGKPMRVTFKVHDQTIKQNAYYEKGVMIFGEGDEESYPVVAPSVVAHEMSHGFTDQHSNLIYANESGGLNESFSDMADKAVEYFVDGNNNWAIDPELLKVGGHVLRYMDEPTKNCGNRQPGDHCSIDHVKDYHSGLDVHNSSGVYNKAFYLIANKWNTRKAFEVMVQANLNYWTENETFESAACGVLKAAKDYKYDEETVREALKEVGIAADQCG